MNETETTTLKFDLFYELLALLNKTALAVHSLDQLIYEVILAI